MNYLHILIPYLPCISKKFKSSSPGEYLQRVFLRRGPDAGTKTHLPPKIIFSSDLGHFVFEIAENVKKYKRNKKMLNFSPKGGPGPRAPPLVTPLELAIKIEFDIFEVGFGISAPKYSI